MGEAVLKIVGIIIASVLLTIGLGKAFPVLTIVGFILLVGVMLWVATTPRVAKQV